MTKQRFQNEEAGLSIIAVLVSFGLASVMMGAISLNLATSLRIGKHTEVHFAAATLAGDHMEELASIDVTNLGPADGDSGSVVTFTGLNVNFNRTSTVTVNADQSRTITVTVSSTSSNLPTTVTYSTTLAEWE